MPKARSEGVCLGSVAPPSTAPAGAGGRSASPQSLPISVLTAWPGGSSATSPFRSHLGCSRRGRNRTAVGSSSSLGTVGCRGRWPMPKARSEGVCLGSVANAQVSIVLEITSNTPARSVPT